MKIGIVGYSKLYFIFCRQYIKSLLQSKVDFLMGLIGFLCSQASGIIFLYLIFKRIPALSGWSFEQLIFIYGFSQIPRGLDHLFTDNLWMLAWQMVVRGTFDRYMLRPMNLFFQIICEKIQFDALGEVLIGLILVCRAIKLNIINISMKFILCFILSVVAGAIIYTSVKLFFASLAFWVKESAPFLQTAYDTSDFAKYPIEVYPKIIKFVLVYIMPFAFVAYIPATYFLNKNGFFKTVGMECVISIIIFNISYFVFKKGTERYESAGN